MNKVTGKFKVATLKHVLQLITETLTKPNRLTTNC